jgi:flagellar biosynthetic protein FlhB
MAGDKHSKTEKPTGRRKKEARQKGQIAKSQDLAIWAIVLVCSFVVPTVFRHGYQSERTLFAQVSGVMANPDQARALALFGHGLQTVLLTLGPLFGAAAVTAIVVNLAQTGLVIKKSAFKPDFKRLNPKNGIKRILSPNGLFTLLRSLVKIGIVSALAYQQFHSLARTLVQPGVVPMPVLASLAARKALTFVRTVASVGLILGVLDYFMQRRRTNKQMMMSKQEVKEEAKNEEGNPEIKGAIRRRQAKMSRMRMMAEIAHADVVIVNPTHVSVALRYEAGRGAPRVVAKGADAVAAAIRAEAAVHDVPIVEDVPLARALWQVCEIDDEIPADLFEAVARVLAFIFKIRATGAARPIGGGPLRVPARL